MTFEALSIPHPTCRWQQPENKAQPVGIYTKKRQGYLLTGTNSCCDKPLAYTGKKPEEKSCVVLWSYDAISSAESKPLDRIVGHRVACLPWTTYFSRVDSSSGCQFLSMASAQLGSSSSMRACAQAQAATHATCSQTGQTCNQTGQHKGNRSGSSTRLQDGGCKVLPAWGTVKRWLRHVKTSIGAQRLSSDHGAALGFKIAMEWWSMPSICYATL